MESPRAAIELGSGGLAASAGAGATSKARARARVVATTETARRMALPHRSGGEAARISRWSFMAKFLLSTLQELRDLSRLRQAPHPAATCPSRAPGVGGAKTA